MMIARIPKVPNASWEAKRAKLKIKFPQLTDADVNFDKGKKGEMLDKLHVKLGMTFKDLQRMIAEL